MATVRKRVMPSGETRWLAGYLDSTGTRRFKQFERRKDADAFLLRARTEVAAGSHVPDREASTIQHAYDALIATLETEGAARATIHNYRTYYRGHVAPFLGRRLLPKMQPADIGDWLMMLKAEGRTDDTCRRAKIVLGVIYDEAIRRRLAHVNPVRSLRSRRKVRRVEIAEAEEKVKIPERDIVRAILAAAADTGATYLIARDGDDRIVDVKRGAGDKPIVARRAFAGQHPGASIERFRPATWLRPLLSVMAFAGLRIGEARGLAWRRAKADGIAVREAVDRYNDRGPVKTAAALRDVPIGPLLNGILGNWKALSGAGEGADLVFPSENGTPLSYRNVMQRQLGPIQVVLGMVDETGAPLWSAHSFRHFAVSLWIAEGASLKQVSSWAGHESPEFTLKVYGHLFAAGRADRKAVSAAELSVLGDVAATHLQHATIAKSKTLSLSAL